ncbi:LysR family transcriptional regulator [Pendulispora albinea]|uniref:LysR family transcriptional regulator n=1 Tax=Pendulispora albinea TaxID=2741071 RepID=A0ABZ2LQ79_9BACT
MSRIDLNLIRCFVTLYETGSVTETAACMHITQPSASHALSRLREQFADPLFIRTREGMRPTELATQLYATFQDSLGRIDGAVDRTRGFEPGQSDRRFRLSLTDLGEMGLLPRILERVHAIAPRVELEVIPMDIDKVSDWLATGKVDAAICSVPFPGRTRSDVLLHERYVCLLRKEHARIGDSLTLDQYAAEQHVAMAPASGHRLADDVLRERGIERKISLRIRHFSVLPHVLARSDLLAVLPSQIAAMFVAGGGLKMLELPFPVPAFTVRLHRPERAADSSAQRWFHRTIVEALS